MWQRAQLIIVTVICVIKNYLLTYLTFDIVFANAYKWHLRELF